jgi:imidazolonepropionase-like amidohydrolase
MFERGSPLCVGAVAFVTLLLPLAAQTPQGSTQVFAGVTLIAGTGGPPIQDAVLIVRNQRILSVGPAAKVPIPDGAQRVDLTGRTIIPGLINTHGHVGSTDGLQTDASVNTAANVNRQLGLYARYGVTTVVSLGDDREAGFRARAGNSSAALDRARLFVTGPVIAAKTPEEARQAVDAAAAANPDWIKIRVDDNLGASQKMSPEVYRAVIDHAHSKRLRVAAHIFYLSDAKQLLEAGVDFLAHSVRDTEVDREFIAMVKARNVCLSPTLMREVSTFVYESRPSFFDDPFFKSDADPKVVAVLEDPARQASVAANRSAQAYKKALEIARRNVKLLHDAGVRLALGTDTGPPARFQGYFEQLELEEMVKSGLTPSAVITSATGVAAGCVGLADSVGTLQKDRYADFIVLTRNPLDDIRNTRAIESVWVSGNKVPRLP